MYSFIHSYIHTLSYHKNTNTFTPSLDNSYQWIMEKISRESDASKKKRIKDRARRIFFDNRRKKIELHLDFDSEISGGIWWKLSVSKNETRTRHLSWVTGIPLLTTSSAAAVTMYSWHRYIYPCPKSLRIRPTIWVSLGWPTPANCFVRNCFVFATRN